MRPRRGFTMIEALVSMVLATMAITGSFALFTSSKSASARQQREFIAFSIAQQNMELLSSVPSTSALLTSVVPGDINDATGPDPAGGNANGVDGPVPARRRVNELGDPDVKGKYFVYWKIEPSFGALRDIRVYVRYPAIRRVDTVGPDGTLTERVEGDDEKNYVVLETLR